MTKQHILLGVSGGIAAFKSASLASLMVKGGYEVQVLMTEHATRFITPLTFQSLTKRAVVVDTFLEPNPAQIAHIQLADDALAYVIAPATANVVAKLAHGFADDMVTTTALAATCPLLVAPAMNVHMLAHPAVAANLRTLEERGAIVLQPAEGLLACGYTGKGRLPEPEDIFAVLQAVLARRQDLLGLKVLVTAGPTIEEIDPVRYITNASTGKMGYAIAAAAAARGAEVVLVSGPVTLAPPEGVKLRAVRSTEDMFVEVEKHFSTADVFVAAAAPADFRPKERLAGKWKKELGTPSIEWVRTPDVLKSMGERRTSHNQTLVGFAAETEDVLANGRRKLTSKHLDLLVVNDIQEEGSGFAVDTNHVTLLKANGDIKDFATMPKTAVADALWDEILAWRHRTR